MPNKKADSNSAQILFTIVYVHYFFSIVLKKVNKMLNGKDRVKFCAIYHSLLPYTPAPAAAATSPLSFSRSLTWSTIARASLHPSLPPPPYPSRDIPSPVLPFSAPTTYVVGYVDIFLLLLTSQLLDPRLPLALLAHGSSGAVVVAFSLPVDGPPSLQASL